MNRLYFSVLCMLCALVNLAYTPLDPAHPITISGDTIEYGGMTIMPSERCIYIDGSLTDAEASVSPWIFNDFGAAAEHFSDGTADKPMLVYIAPWVYWIDDPDDPETRVGKDGREPFGMVIKCDNLYLTGLTPDPRNVVLAAARGQTQGAIGNFTMLDIWGDGLTVKNMTLGNYCNVDLDYPLNPSLSRPKRMPAITQAHVAYCHGDRAYAENVRFISRLNMNPLNGARRILFNNCHMEMTDDSLTGTGVYLNCSIDYYGAKPFWATHTNGAVFLDCDINMRNNNHRVFFCKGVGQVSVIDCRINAGHPLYMGWTNTPPLWLRCYQHGVTLDGEPYIIGADMPSNTIDISLLPLLRAYRINAGDSVVYNTYNLLCGDDGWDPLGVKPLVEGNDYGTSLIVTPRQVSLRTGQQPVELKAQVYRHSGYPLDNEGIIWSLQPGMEDAVSIEPQGATCTVTPIKDTDGDVTCIVTATIPSGLQGAAELKVSPPTLDAPVYTSAPRLELTKGKAILDYGLMLDGRADESVITWYRCTDTKGHNPIAVGVSRPGKPMREYALTQDDRGHYIMAEICPKSGRSIAGEPTRVISGKPIGKDIAPATRSVETDFSNFPTAIQPLIMPGYWTVDCHKPIDTEAYDWTPDHDRESWIYGYGFNGAVGTGLLQDQRGARLLYTPLPGKYGDMTVTLDVDPTKTAGQGFGSATGQYMDVYIKFDTRTLTGYALRIERTTKYSNAVDFSLVEYDNGTVTPLTEPVSSVCYRTGCHINLSATGDTLSASVYTDTPVSAHSPELTTSVQLTAPIKPTVHGGTGIQHTGTCGESTTMLHRMAINY